MTAESPKITDIYSTLMCIYIISLADESVIKQSVIRRKSTGTIRTLVTASVGYVVIHMGVGFGLMM